MKKIQKNKQKGITLVALVITIVVLVILSAVGIYFALGNNGILNKAKEAKNETLKQAATEKINLKITSIQIETYGKEQRMPTLQEFSDRLCEDDEIQYVVLQSKKVGSLEKIEVGNASSIFTKLKEYPYEFEINSSLQLASIDGIEVVNDTNSHKLARVIVASEEIFKGNDKKTYDISKITDKYKEFTEENFAYTAEFYTSIAQKWGDRQDSLKINYNNNTGILELTSTGLWNYGVYYAYFTNVNIYLYY